MMLPLLILLTALSAAAQNSDLAVMFGPTVRGYTMGTSLRRTETRIGVSILYATQLHESRYGRVYFEAPFLTPVGHSTFANSREVRTTTGGLFFVPGVRYQYPVHPRIAVFGVTGAGVASMQERVVAYDGAMVGVRTQRNSAAAFNYGGGVSFRLTRLLSLRFEGRDLISSVRTGFFHFGFALHF